MKKIIQTGTYNSKNKGDAAMEISTATALTRQMDNVEVVISSPFPNIDRTFYNPFRVIPCSRRRLIFATIQLLRCALWISLKKLSLFDARFLVPDQEINEFLEADIIIDLSGDMLTEDYGVHVTYSHYLPLLMAIVLGKKFAICAQSIGPFKWTRRLAKFILNRAVFISARETITIDYLKTLALDSAQDKVYLTADMAFLLEKAPEEEISLILKKENIPDESRNLIGVSLSSIVKAKYESENPLAHSLSFFQFMGLVLSDISMRFGADLVFISHVTGPKASKDDRIIGSKIVSHVSCAMHVLRGDYNPIQLKGIIAKCDLFLGARMHANIAALSSGVPTVAIAYSHKTPGIMKYLRQDDSTVFISNTTPEEITGKFATIFSRRQHCSKVLCNMVKKAQESAQSNIDLITKAID